MEVCVLLEHVLISNTGGVCYLWVLEASFREVGVLDDAYSALQKQNGCFNLAIGLYQLQLLNQY